MTTKTRPNAGDLQKAVNYRENLDRVRARDRRAAELKLTPSEYLRMLTRYAELDIEDHRLTRRAKLTPTERETLIATRAIRDEMRDRLLGRSSKT